MAADYRRGFKALAERLALEVRDGMGSDWQGRLDPRALAKHVGDHGLAGEVRHGDGAAVVLGDLLDPFEVPLHLAAHGAGVRNGVGGSLEAGGLVGHGRLREK